MVKIPKFLTRKSVNTKLPEIKIRELRIPKVEISNRIKADFEKEIRKVRELEKRGIRRNRYGPF